MGRTSMVAVFFLFFGSMCGEGFLAAQESPIKILGKLVEKADIDALFKAKPTLTTSLADAVTEVPFLDDFQPNGFEPLSLQPRGPGGTFLIKKGGLYVFEAESYCLLAGTHAPSKGDGYLQAPLKGPRAEIIRNILLRAADHPKIPQENIQVLLWAILARAKIDFKSGNLLKTAQALLTPKEILDANGGALGLISGKLLDKGLDKISPALRDIYKAEAELRNALSRAESSYEELERIAVLSGEASPSEDKRMVPWGRWSYNPQGYFIRYFPNGYPRNVIELYQPEVFAIERDSLGRVTVIAHPDGERIEMEYKTEGSAPAVPGDPAMSACAVSAIRLAYVYPKGVGRVVETECPDPGWTLIGNPGEKGRPLPESEGFPALAKRYEDSLKHKMEIKKLLDGLKKTGRGIPADGIDEKQWAKIMSLYHVVETLKAAGKLKNPDWMSDPVELAYMAWQSEFRQVAKEAGHGDRGRGMPISGIISARMGSMVMTASPLSSTGNLAFGWGASLPAVFDLASGEGSDTEAGGDEFEPIDLTPDGAQPANPGSQKEGNSNRGTQFDQKCAGEYGGCKILALDDYVKCTGGCLGMDVGVENPSRELRMKIRMCLIECEQQNRRDKRDCVTLVRNCLGL